MVKINKKVEYSLIVLKHLNSKEANSQVTAREICDLYHTPFDTTSRVMQKMNSKGILGSTQGKNGGYKLMLNLDKVSYLELFEIIEGRKAAKDCTQMNCSLVHSCNITGPINRLNQYLLNFFSGLSIKELLEDTSLPNNIFKSMKAINE